MELFRPRTGASQSDVPVLGWIGTHSTYPYLESIFPVLERLAGDFRFRLKVVGASRQEITVQGIEVENLEWRLEREVEDFQSFDIGLYPILEDNWAAGKSGFKAIQYMAVGIPFVSTPIGASGEIGDPGQTHFQATSEAQWYEVLGRLLSDTALRRRMGESGRAHALEHYTLEAQANKLAQVLRDAVSS
jgi:glycosyltransferase involved in cell wall biosynthesis